MVLKVSVPLENIEMPTLVYANTNDLTVKTLQNEDVYPCQTSKEMLSHHAFDGCFY